MSDISLPSLYLEKVVEYLGSAYPQRHRPNNDLPLLVLTQGSAAVVVEVSDWGTQNIKILIWTYVVTGARIDHHLLKFLLRQNELLRFGGFSLDSDGDIRLQACIYGMDFSPNELLLMLKEMLETADYYDDEIIFTWGGKRAIDHVAHIPLPLPS